MTKMATSEVVARGEACCVCCRHEAKFWRSANDGLLGGDEVFVDVRCVWCGTVRLQPRPPAGEMARYYSALTYARAEDEGSELGRRLDEFFAHQAARVSEAIGFKADGRKLLDVGCGDGRFLKAMSSLGWAGEGVETDPIAAQLARRRSNATVHETPLEELNMGARRFDLISLLHVLEHVPNPRETLMRAYGLLNPEGKLLLALPNVRCIESSLFGRSWYQLDLPRHFWGFTPQTLVRLVEECGFAQPTVRYLPFLFAPQSLRHAVRSLRGSKPGHAGQRADVSVAKVGGGRLQTRIFLGLLRFSERIGRTFPGEIMELTATRPDGETSARAKATDD